jgi:hypothetical protein
MAKKRGRPKKRAKRGPPFQCVLLHTQLRPIIREAARTGLVEAIEHTTNFWQAGEGYKKYIDQQIALQSEALMAAVRSAVRSELTRVVLPQRRRR